MSESNYAWERIDCDCLYDKPHEMLVKKCDECKKREWIKERRGTRR